MGMILNIDWMPDATHGGTAPGRRALYRAIAEAAIGAGEVENNKGTRIKEYWGNQAPIYYGKSWCAAFVRWTFEQEDGTNVFPPLALALQIRNYLRDMKWLYFDSKKGVSAYTGVIKPEPGDIVIFDRLKDNDIFAHVGLVHNSNNGQLITIEGNHNQPGAALARVEGFEYDLDAMPRLLALGRIPNDFRTQQSITV